MRDGNLKSGIALPGVASRLTRSPLPSGYPREGTASWPTGRTPSRGRKARYIGSLGARAERILGGMARQVVSPRLIGRAPQLNRLGEALTDAQQRRPSVLLVRGEAGVGKTRLLHEFLSTARDRGARTLLGGCVDVSAGDLPYVPIRTWLRRLLEDRGAEELAALLGTTYHELEVLLPDLPPVAPAGDDRIAGTRHVFQVVASLVAALAGEACIVLAVDDAQWADVSTLQLLRYLRQDDTPAQLLVVVAYRGEELPNDASWRKAFEELTRSAAGVVDVGALDQDEVHELVSAFDVGIPKEAVVRVQARADGVPFLVEELVAAERDGLTRGIPSRFREVLGLRFGALPAAARHVAQLIAASGRPAEHRVLAKAAGLSRQALATAVDAGLRANLLVEDAVGRTYSFRHDLMREIVYEDLPGAARRDLHASLAAALEDELPPEPYATRLGEVAHHWLQSDDNDDAAMRAAVRAARASCQAFAYPEAVRQYDQVLALWHRVENSEDVCGGDVVTVLAEAAEAAHWAGYADAALRHIQRALDVIGPDDKVRGDMLHERRTLYSWLHEGHLERGPKLLDQIKADCTRERMRASELMQNGQYSDSVPVARNALQLAVQARSSSDEIRAGYILAVGLAETGDVAEGLATISEKLALAMTRGTTEEVVAGHVNMAFILIHDGQLEEAARVALTGLDEAVRRGAAAVDGALLAANSASCLIRLGRLVETDRVLREALSRRPPPVLEMILRLTLAESDLLRGHLAEAEAALREIAKTSLTDDYQVRVQLLFVEAELQLWSPANRTTILLPDLRDVAGSHLSAQLTGEEELEGEDVLMQAHLYWLGIRADADAAAFARMHAADEQISDRIEDGCRLEERLRALTKRGLGDGAMRQVERFILLGAAESARLREEPSADLWRQAADAWEGEPYPQAYSLWRQGSALLGLRRRRAAGDALRAAHRLARDADMQILVAATTATGLALGIRMDAAVVPQQAARPARPFNLTPKEMEVLKLLVEGFSNRRIATALHMTEKTASVHVSRILTKLSVDSRGQAVARAYEIGLAQPDAVQQG